MPSGTLTRGEGEISKKIRSLFWETTQNEISRKSSAFSTSAQGAQEVQTKFAFAQTSGVFLKVPKIVADF